MTVRIVGARGAESATPRPVDQENMANSQQIFTAASNHAAGRNPATLSRGHAPHALREYTRRCRTASASTSSTGSVCDQLRHASVIDTPYCNGTPGFRS